jgi:hypothetical protein
MVSIVLGLMFSSAVHCLADYMKRFVWEFTKIFTDTKILLDGACYLLRTLWYASFYWQFFYSHILPYPCFLTTVAIKHRIP